MILTWRIEIFMSLKLSQGIFSRVCPVGIQGGIHFIIQSLSILYILCKSVSIISRLLVRLEAAAGSGSEQ